MEGENRPSNHSQKVSVGYSMLNVLSNIAYAGMRAQNSENRFGRVCSFWLGFPGTLLTYFLVD